MIDKNNKLWKWKKANKQTINEYKKMYGLMPDEIGTMTKKSWEMYEKLLLNLIDKQS